MPVCVESMMYVDTHVNLIFGVWRVMDVSCGISVRHETPSVWSVECCCKVGKVCNMCNGISACASVRA